MPLSNTQIGAFVKGDYSSALDLGTALFSTNLSRGTAFDSGTGAGQVDKIWTDTRTLTASSSEDLDLSGAAILDAFGAAAVFARIKGILVSAAPGNTNNVLVGANVAAAWNTLFTPSGAGTGGQVILRPGCGFVAWCGSADAIGWTVTATTADLLHITNSAGGTSVTYDIALIGCSA